MIYPRWKYNALGDAILVENAGEDPGEGWADTPAEFGIVTCPAIDEETPQAALQLQEKKRPGRPRKEA